MAHLLTGRAREKTSPNAWGADVGDHLVNAKSGFREADFLILPLLLCCFTKNDSMSQHPVRKYGGDALMPNLTTQQDFRTVQKLPFCYLCCEHFKPGDDINRDHMPPSALFEQEDRDVPLILPTHVECNAREHVSDEIIGQFVSLIHGRPSKRGRRPLDATVGQIAGKPITLIRGLSINRLIRRCVRGFHAALYHESLPSDTSNVFHPPLRGGDLDGDTGQPTDEVQAMLVGDQGVGQHARFSTVLKQNRIAGNTDTVVSRNGKCVYECVWSKLDNGTPICIFGLKIYEWQQFDQLAGYPPRGCVGIYWPTTGRPKIATRETELEFPFSNNDALDPFGQ